MQNTDIRAMNGRKVVKNSKSKFHFSPILIAQHPALVPMTVSSNPVIRNVVPAQEVAARGVSSPVDKGQYTKFQEPHSQVKDKVTNEPWSYSIHFMLIF